MTKIAILILVALLSLTAQAQFNLVVLQDGAATNKSRVSVGGTMTAVVNQLPGSSSFDVGTSTNLGTLLRGNSLRIEAQNVGIVVAGSGLTSAVTNPVTYTFQRSHDATNWSAWTNFTVTPTGTARHATNFVLVLGDYQFMRVSDATNENSTLWRSNYLAVGWKK